MLALWCLGDLTPWALFVPMAISSVGNGISQPPGVAAGLSVYPRIAGAASGLLGFTQMTVAALGTLLLGLLPRDSAVAMMAVVGTSLTLAFLCGLLALPQHLRICITGRGECSSVLCALVAEVCKFPVSRENSRKKPHRAQKSVVVDVKTHVQSIT
jgi:hypothetical protein